MAEQQCKKAIYSEDYLDLIVEYNDEVDTIYNQFDVSCVHLLNSRYSIVQLSRSVYPPYSISTYGYQKIPKCFGLMEQSALQETGIIRIQNSETLNLRGQNILIAFIDTGIDYTNPIFQRANGTTRIVSIWDQTIESGNSPNDFFYGSEYKKQTINLALQSENPLEIVPSRDENGHGTFMAGVCAGSKNEKEDFIGGAPESELIIVKLKPAKENLKQFWNIHTEEVVYQETDLMLAVQYVTKVAKQLLRPLVICFGIGSNQGGKDGKDPFSSYLSSFAESNGVCIVTPAGNEGQGRNHYFRSGIKGKSMDLVEWNSGTDQGVTMELWGKSPNTYSIGIRSPGGETIPRIQPGLSESREVQLILEKTKIRIDYQLIESGSGDEVIVLSFENPTKGIWAIEVYCDELDNSGFHIWLPITQFLSETTYFLRPNPDTTIVSPSSTASLITFTAYRHENNSLYLKASRGYSRSCGIKPDMASPGVNVYGPNLRQGFTTKTGSSVASAIGASACALLLEWGIVRGNIPSMGTNEVKKLLVRGAIRENEMNYPNREWGYGRFNLYETFQSLTRL